MCDPTEDLSRDMAVKIASYLKSRKDFFAFSSANRKLRRFFKDEREKIIRQDKIILSDDRSSFYLTFAGDVYACGVNFYGELGLGDTINRNRWTKTGPPGKKVLRILSKAGSTFAFCDDGLYACGLNAVGQLGFKGKTSISSWLKIGPFGKTVLALEVATAKVFVRCEDGWYGSGHNFWGEFGTGELGSRFQWLKIEIPGKYIFELKAEDRHTFARCEDGWYACGSNEHGELLRGERQSRILNWIKISPPGKIVLELICRAETLFFRCEDGWYARGNNCYGQLGKGDRKDALDWIKIGVEDKNIDELYISDSGCSTFIRCQDQWYGAGLDPSAPLDWMRERVRLTWTKLEIPGKKILEVSMNLEEEILIRCDDAWYGPDYKWVRREPESPAGWSKIGPDGEAILKLVSKQGAFILYEDGWYAAGDNTHGQLGIGKKTFQKRSKKISLVDNSDEVDRNDAREPEEKRFKMDF